MQAIRLSRKRPLDARWFQHVSLLGAVGVLFSSVVAARPQAAVQIVESLPVQLLAPATSTRDWRPVRVPVRTKASPEPYADVSIEGTQVESVKSDGTRWVQAHKASMLRAAPDDGAARQVEIPQWSYLKLLDSRPGWLRVSYAVDGSSRTPNVAWIPTADVGDVAGPPPRFVTSTRETPLWSGDEPGAETVTTVPRLSMLERANLERNGRVAVRFAESDSEATLAWVDGEAITGSLPPLERDIPLDRPFSPFVNSVRLSVPYRTQLDGSISATANCGPASIGMVMEAFGVAVPTNQIRWHATRFMGIYSPWSGTTLESLRAVAESVGLEGQDLHQGGRYKRWTVEDVRRHLRAGHPVIPQLRYRLMPGREWFGVTFDHFVVITGMDGDNFIYNDPATIGNGERVMSAQALQRAWMGSDHPGAALAVARPL